MVKASVGLTLNPAGVGKGWRRGDEAVWGRGDDEMTSRHRLIAAHVSPSATSRRRPTVRALVAGT